MSKGPSPRVDQLRAMREAQFALNAARQKVVEKPAVDTPVKAAKPAAAEKAVEVTKTAPAKHTKNASVKKAKKKKGKT